MQPTLKQGQRFFSPGGNFEYEVIGACCLLYDRELLPYPSCSLNWKGKQPSWRRIGRRFINDMSASNSEVYYVKLIDSNFENLSYSYWVFTYWEMEESLKKWWHKS